MCFQTHWIASYRSKQRSYCMMSTLNKKGTITEYWAKGHRPTAEWLAGSDLSALSLITRSLCQPHHTHGVTAVILNLSLPPPLQDAGVYVITDLTVETRPCEKEGESKKSSWLLHVIKVLLRNKGATRDLVVRVCLARNEFARHLCDDYAERLASTNYAF